MKISELTNDQAADVMARLVTPVSAICEDEDALKAVDEYKKMYRMPVYYAVGKVLPQLVAVLFKAHKAEVYEIISILSGKPAGEVSKMKFAETVQIIKESYADTLSVFFPSSGDATKAAGKGSSSAS